MTQTPTSRAEAREAGVHRYNTGKPCKHGHMCDRYLSGACVECSRTLVEQHMKRSAANRAKRQRRGRSWIEANQDRSAALFGLARVRREYPHAVPDDFSLDETIPFYAARRQLTEETGREHHVDHIVPLCRGGMHAPDNLQVLTAEENILKADKLPAQHAGVPF